MKKIGILSCIKSTKVCTGASCLKAFNERERAFSIYKDQPVQLMAFMYCNGCECDYATDEGYLEKLDRLDLMGVETMHVGICTVNAKKGEECPHITDIIKMMQNRGIKVIRGTH